MTRNSFISGPERAHKQSTAERKPEKTALKHTQFILENILENFPGIVFWKDRSSVYQGCNKNFASVAGYSDPAELQGKTDYDIPRLRDYAEKFRADDQQVMASGKPMLNIVETIHSADGTDKLYSTNKVPLRDAGGRIIGVLCIGNDITEHRLADEQLKLTNAILQTQQETALEGILIVNEQREIISYNRRFVEMWGIPEDVAVSHSDERAVKVITDRLADPEKFAEKVTYLYNHPYERSFDEIKLKGNITFKRYSAPMIGPDGRYYGRVWYFRDITEQKRAEEALKAEHDQLLSIFDSIDEMIYVSDPYTYEVLFVNKWGQKKHGIEAVGGKCYREFQGRMLPCDFCTNAIILKEKGKPYYWEYHNPVVNRDYWIVDKIIKWSDGRDVRFEMALDITDHKQALADAKDAKARAELYLDLMSHDLTNMNQAIMGHLELMETLLEPGSSEKELTDISAEIIKRSARMINNVKKLTEIEAGKVPLRAVDLCAILSQVVSEHSGPGGLEVRINTKICQKCEVMAGEMLKEIFENLVDNAIRHAGGPVIVDVAVERVARDGQGYYQVSIADNGPGIPDGLKRRLFQSAQELEKKAERRGFGLYVVRTLVKHYRGKVWVEDRVPGDYSRGSKFVVLLPEGRSTTTGP